MTSDRWLAGDAYEVYMGRWSRPLARAFVAWLNPQPASAWLDVGCGTGALTRTVCEFCAPASILACDPSEPFIDHARKELSDSRASFVVAGAAELPTRDGGFDYIVSGLALNFVPDPARAVSHMCESLRAGGTVAAYVWDYAEGMEFLRAFWDEAVAGDADAATLDEGRRFPLCRREALDALFRSAGFARVETNALEVPTHFTGFDDYWAPFLSGTGPAPGYVASLDLDRRDALRERLERRLANGLALKARAWAVRGAG